MATMTLALAFDMSVFLLLSSNIILFILLILVTFVPALTELMRPKDAGPRKIIEIRVDSEPYLEMAWIDKMDGTTIDETISSRVAQMIASLPNIDA